MSVRKGEAWGVPGPLADDGVLVRSDRDARAAILAARRNGAPVPELGLLGGDLARTVGATGDVERLRSDVAQRLPLDVGTVLVDGRLDLFVAHLVVRRPLWQGSFVVVMNAEHLGPMKMAPRAHPGDGSFDLLQGSLGLDQRLQARRRARTGDHVPHPRIEVRRTAALQVDVPKGAAVWLDGVRIGRARTLSVRVDPEAVIGVV